MHMGIEGLLFPKSSKTDKLSILILTHFARNMVKI